MKKILLHSFIYPIALFGVYLLVFTTTYIYIENKDFSNIEHTNLASVSTLSESLPAFPGAEGFGVNTPGGRNGAIIEVTNLSDSGPGSLRNAVNTSGRRIVVFRTSGIIELATPLKITNPYITIAGQTSPEGITLKNGLGNLGTPIDIQTHDVVVRYLKVRPGPAGLNQAQAEAKRNEIATLRTSLQNTYGTAWEAHRSQLYNIGAGCCLGTIQVFGSGTYNVIIDHVSMSWGFDENFEITTDSHDVTVSWSVVSEAMEESLHYKGNHAYGVIFTARATNISFHHNYLAHNYFRNPRISSGLIDFVNNIIYNPWRIRESWTDQDNSPKVNYIGNVQKAGPETRLVEYLHAFAIWNTGRAYVKDNYSHLRKNDSVPDNAVVLPEVHINLVLSPFPTPTITTNKASNVPSVVLSDVGANKRLTCDGRFVNARDAVDTRVINDYYTGGGQLIDHPDEVGGWPIVSNTTPCTDSDHDGMPNEWETKFGLNPNLKTDNWDDEDGDGYTNIEEYLNGTDPVNSLDSNISLATQGSSEDGFVYTQSGIDENMSPVVNAGEDIITNTGFLSLSGYASDDRKPDWGKLTVEWSVKKTPGDFYFENRDTLTPTLYLSYEGGYEFEIKAFDGVFYAYDTIKVTYDKDYDGSIALEGSSGLQESETGGEDPIEGIEDTILITRWMTIGVEGEDVKQLQIFLNNNRFTVAQSGAGSPGNETSYYGSLTEDAIKRFQCAKDIVCSGNVSSTGYGAVGPKTRAALSGR